MRYLIPLALIALFSNLLFAKGELARKDSLTLFDFNSKEMIMKMAGEGGGFSSGGGGNSVVCFDGKDQITEVNLLDYYEGIRKDQLIEKRVYLEGDSIEEKIKSAFRKMEKGFPYLAKKLRNRALWLTSRIDNFLIESKDGKLTPIYDMDLPFVPNQNEKGETCQIVRFAVQLKKQVAGQRKFYFVKELFNHPLTSTNTKAGIILHEVIYEEAIQSGATDSDFVRWFTYLLSSTTFDKMSEKDIRDLEREPGGDFLAGLGGKIQPGNITDEEISHNEFSPRDSVYFLDIYRIELSGVMLSCFDLGICQVFSAEYLGKKPSSSSLFPQYTLMMKESVINTSAGKEIKKVRGEVWGGYANKVASTREGACHPDGGCIGNLIGVNVRSDKGVVSYTGVIVGIFSEGDFAVRLIDGRFNLIGIDMNPYLYSSHEADIILYASRESVTLVE